MNRYLLTPAAQRDLFAIWDYTAEQWGIRQAEKYIRDLQKAIEDLAEHPQWGRSREEIRDGYRSYTCGKHVVFYRTPPNSIDIVRLLHERMDFDSHL